MANKYSREQDNELVISRMLIKGYRTTMIGSSRAISALFDKIPAVARAKCTTLISGPTGSGKEVLAKALHEHAFGSHAPFIPVNCGALPEELIESELFGHARGAFTGAAERKGLISAANKGVLFLDEINSSNLQFQAKILRFLESKEYRPVGSDRIEKANDVWVLAATNHNLKEEVREGRFREDLLYRLNVVHLKIPPLRERIDDIEVLARHFLNILGGGKYRISDRAMSLINAYDWPGNVRELKHCIERAMIFSKNHLIDIDNVELSMELRSPSHQAELNDSVVDLWQLVESNGLSLGEAMAFCEKKLICAALRAEKNNRSRAAQRLGIHNRTIFKKINGLNYNLE
ncbi:MAG: sigma-54 dependent transcriptional regulator [Candidatus Thiodiazotropha sp. (ex Dulcina madagascariensis)]|nr:sigma-54 dependent transcriptional regulator [Candidatus Thiodiazotropha sp. (ex Dulcina madagascariensis)]MCU7925941.1 sigma-54 dependent transcriptional regulator [Candidatus Thiodiazotropha sp. (ex Dulcina madagascariensis)]